MGKRLIRIRATELLNNWTAETVAQLINAEVNVVFIDGRTLRGRLIEKLGADLSVRDHRNHGHIVPIQTIEEVILDEKAPF
ncbi:hypothetical protein GCM10027299_46290 [Larkinella ripae]